MALENDHPQAEESTDRKDVLAEQFAALEEPPETKTERARDETGKFAKVEKTEKPAEAQPETEAPIEQPVEEPLWKRPPKSWKKDYHEVWQTADDRLKEYAWQREEQMAAGVQPLKQKAQFADEMNAVVEPYLPTIKGLGYTVPQVMKGFFEADAILRNGQPQQKLAYLVQLAQNYGIDLSPLTGMASQAAPVDQNYRALLNELNNLRGEVKTRWEREEEAQNQVLLSDIHQFAQNHEHFETVRPVMVTLLQSGAAETLDEAYKKAVRLDDSLFESEVQARQAQTVSIKDQAAKKARSAAVSVRSSTPGSNTAPKAQNRREVLLEQFDGIDSRL